MYFHVPFQSGRDSQVNIAIFQAILDFSWQLFVPERGVRLGFHDDRRDFAQRRGFLGGEEHHRPVNLGLFANFLIFSVGSLLVGLRWWSEIKEDGSESWIFESKDSNFRPNVVDSAFFWTSQVVSAGVWLFFLVLNVLSFTFYWVFLREFGVFLRISRLGDRRRGGTRAFRDKFHGIL